MTSGMPLKEIPVSIVNLTRYGKRGWSFDAVVNHGKPGEYGKSFRTSPTGKGLERLICKAEPAEHKYGMDFPARPEVWRTETWLSEKYQWPKNQPNMEKQLRIFFKNIVRIIIDH